MQNKVKVFVLAMCRNLIYWKMGVLAWILLLLILLIIMTMYCLLLFCREIKLMLSVFPWIALLTRKLNYILGYFLESSSMTCMLESHMSSLIAWQKPHLLNSKSKTILSQCDLCPLNYSFRNTIDGEFSTFDFLFPTPYTQICFIQLLPTGVFDSWLK